MLILQRKAGESLEIGDAIRVSVLSVEGGRVRLAIEAPQSVPILRSELKIAVDTNRESARAPRPPLELLGALRDAMEKTEP